MIRAVLRPVVVFITITIGSFALPGCGDDSGGESKSAPAAKSSDAGASSLLGTYENANDKMTIELKSGGVVVMTEEGAPSTLTWETDGKDKIVIHGQDGINLIFNVNSEGNLSDAMGLGSVFRRKK